ncbi:MAG: hypothetical protein IT536_21675 [Hyphomicrobiales bacterium]|nr:hypothetical protein [Hyphomicrobiales bacterium]
MPVAERAMTPGPMSGGRQDKFARLARALYWFLLLALVGFATLYIVQALLMIPKARHEYQWGFILGGVFGAAALLMRSRFEALRIVGTWLGIVMILQLFVPDSLGLASHHFRRPSNTVHYVEPRDIPNIQGLQIVSTDGQGLRSDPPVDYARKQRLRIAVFGGSAAEEFILDDRATWSNRLQQSLRRERFDVEVINAGVSGTRLVHHIASLEYVLRFEPDLALLLIGFNDMAEGMRLFTAPMFIGERLRPTNTLLHRTVRLLRSVYLPRDHPSPERFARLPDGSVPDVPQQYRKQFTRREARRSPPPLPKTLPKSVHASYDQELQRLARLCSGGKVRCMVMTQPSAFQRGADPQYLEAIRRYEPIGDSVEPMIGVAEMYHDHLRAFAKRHKIALCDLAAAIQPSFEVFFDSHHYNTPGAQRIGALVAQCVLPLLPEAARLAPGAAEPG